MKIKSIGDYDFIEIKDGNAHLYFSTAKNNLDFNLKSDIGLNNINNIKKWFGVDEVGYLNQIHSDDIYIYDEKTYNGDALISDKKNIAIGVFTADCVPILIYDKKNQVFAAVHSGWKGTLACIVEKTVIKMKEEFGCKVEDINAVIGPHNMECCYEFGYDTAEKFKEVSIYKREKIYLNGRLNLQKCIEKQLENSGVKSFKSLNQCTNCSTKYEFYSYRRDGNKAGRMFSFIFLK
ncbi:peptidoglycan editing factor PgeF [Clostridium guangxiense]|uniref:peptidoglycan editing factor PgeF n=2 Tax=Clostridium TaxID=1485 RepID=UPI001E313B80|nr:peptidoglycan editing factor PgeF [Clostridium guangxiense]MCD2346056.1 peptidoglycan editing factor PgeF [Clostridium guangxiense]